MTHSPYCTIPKIKTYPDGRQWCLTCGAWVRPVPQVYIQDQGNGLYSIVQVVASNLDISQAIQFAERVRNGDPTPSTN